MQQGTTGVPTAVIAHLPLKTVMQLLPGTEAQPYALQECTISPELLLSGVKWEICRFCSVSGCLSLLGFQLPIPLVRDAGLGASRLGFRLLGDGIHAFCNSEASGSPVGGLVSSLVASYSHVAGYPVESYSPPLRGQALQSAQDGGGEAPLSLGCSW